MNKEISLNNSDNTKNHGGERKKFIESEIKIDLLTAPELNGDALFDMVASANQDYNEPPFTNEELRNIVDEVKSEWLRENATKIRINYNNDLPFERFQPFRKGGAPIVKPIQPEILGNNSYAQAAKDICKLKQLPLEMVLFGMLTVVSSAVQRKFEVKISQGYQENLNLYTCIVAKPGSGKSAALNLVAYPAYTFQKEKMDERQAEIAETISQIKSLKNDLKHCKEDEQRKSLQAEIEELEKNQKTEFQLILNDTTAESVVTAMKENNERISIFTAESNFISNVAGRYNNNPSISIFNSAFGGEFYSSNRVTRGNTVLQNPSCVILLYLQNIYADKYLFQNEELLNSGFTSRFIFIFPPFKERTLNENTYTNQESIKKYDEAITNLYNMPERVKPSVIKISNSADDFRNECHGYVEEMVKKYQNEPIGEWYSRAFTQFAKIAAILHIMNYGVLAAEYSIPAERLKDAWEIWKSVEQYTVYAYTQLSITRTKAEQDAIYLIDKLLDLPLIKDEDGHYYILESNLQQKVKGKFSKVSMLKPGLKELEERGYIHIEKKQLTNGKKPSELIFINPDVFE